MKRILVDFDGVWTELPVDLAMPLRANDQRH